MIHIMEKQKTVKGKGGTMRLGAYPCNLAENTLARRIYGQVEVGERHRHRYEFNNAYRKQLQECGLILSGVYPKEDLVEIVEITEHPWFESFVGACAKAHQGQEGL